MSGEITVEYKRGLVYLEVESPNAKIVMALSSKECFKLVLTMAQEADAARRYNETRESLKVYSGPENEGETNDAGK